eukprot:TRINITY_DN5002_c0_g1_i1.p1 TRINITY_DN5002_c0_g1~~TRINITY_DN5002_c0_g1_i1.p1  ORF type:complete len:763 (+),score=242.75 TRINITY_DN5002_c0_g1_i1:51-2291(+)
MRRASTVLAAAAAAAQQTGPGYTYWCQGDCGGGGGGHADGGLVLMGGSTDVDEAFEWMVRRSGSGDFLTLRTSGADGYDSYVRGFGAKSGATLLLTEAGSRSDFVLGKIAEAEAIWFAGGDQATYVDFWNGTELAAALTRAVARGAVVGGTSAGCALLGRVVYTARTGSVVSADALRNPYDPRIDLGVGFVDYPQAPRSGVTDQHFQERDRFGRMLAFMARRVGGGVPTGIGVDERTALLISPDGSGRAVGSGTAYIARGGSPEVVEAGRSLTYRDVAVTCLRAPRGGRYDFGSWKGVGKAGDGFSDYTVSVVDGEARDGEGSSYLYCSATAAGRRSPPRQLPARTFPDGSGEPGQGPPQVCPDGSQCPYGGTCCRNARGGYGCCAGGDGVCCAGGLACCPGGYHCGGGGSRCDADDPKAHPLAEWQPSWPLCEGPLPLQRMAVGRGNSFPYYAASRVEDMPSTVRLAVIMVHGAGRNADQYYCSLKKAAAMQTYLRPEEVFVIAPWFTQPQDQTPPRTTFWNGDDSEGVWRYGADSDSLPHISSYEVMDRLVAAVRKAGAGSLRTVTVAGHSSGGQFVQRYALTHPRQSGASVRFVVANPSSYAYMDETRYVDGGWGTPPPGCPDYDLWKWGLAGNAERMPVPYVFGQPLRERVRRYPHVDVTYLAGQNDTCNEEVTPGCDSFGLEKTCMDMLEGEQRLARAETFVSYLRHHYGRRVHRFAEVPNAGHDHTLVFQSAEGLRAVFG